MKVIYPIKKMNISIKTNKQKKPNRTSGLICYHLGTFFKIPPKSKYQVHFFFYIKISLT